MDRKYWHELLKELEEAIQKAHGRLNTSQKSYKRDFDAQLRRANLDFEAGYYIFLDPTLQEKKNRKLMSLAVDTYRVIASDKLKFLIERAEVTERVNRNKGSSSIRRGSSLRSCRGY